MLSEDDIEAGRTPKGGFSRAQLAAWGVPWPPPKGWKSALLGKESTPVPIPTVIPLGRRITKEELEAGRTPKGGFRRAQLAAWGVPWPPPAGWKEALVVERTKVGPLGRPLTEQDIEAGKSPNGGFTRDQLAAWGVPWPAPKGWKNALLRGKDPSLLRRDEP